MTASLILLLLAALVAANLPFFSNRILLLAPVSGKKGLAWRLLELALLYGLCAVLAWFLERQQGPVHPQNWQFYVTTGFVFLVLAFPGFVIRYLWRRQGA